ncbi:PINIT domain-containing protein, partial [Trichostrongylus colubriformis]
SYLQAVIPTNKPNVEPKRPSRPVDITQQCLNVRDPSRPSRLMVEWTGDKRVWAVAVYLVFRVTSDILRDRALGIYTGPTYGKKEPVEHHQGEHVTRDVIRARLGGGNDDEIAMAQLKISLLCPVRVVICVSKFFQARLFSKIFLILMK